MAGYSGTPLVRKLGIREDSRIIFVNEPENFRSELGDLPDGVRTEEQLEGEFDYIHFFTREKSALERDFPELKDHLKKSGLLWVSWPKRASGIQTDLSENAVRAIGLENGLVDVKVAAIDAVWSGLKFVYRTADR